MTDEQKANEAKAAALFKLIEALISTKAAGVSMYADADMLHAAMSELKALGFSVHMRKDGQL